MSRVAFSQHCEFHGDIPTPARAAFTQNEQAWALQADLAKDYVTPPPFKTPEKWIPIGVSGKMAMGFGTSLAPAHRQRSMLLEQDQFAKVWINTLLRTRYRQQYQAIHERFLGMVKKDPSLKMAAEMVLRCAQVLEFRDKLPTEKSDDEQEQGLDNAIAARHDGRYQSAEYTGLAEPPEDEQTQKVALYTLDYRDETAATWKLAMIFKCQYDTLPTAHLTADNHLYVAYYATEHAVKVMHFDDTQKVVDTWYTEETGMRGPLTCDVDVVTDGHVVYEKCGRKHWIEEDMIITSVSRAQNGDLYLGTFAGHVYNVTQMTFIKTRDPLAVLNIKTSGGDNKYIVQTINDVTFDTRLLNIGRPLASAVKGTMVVTLSKYGVISLCFMGANSFYPPPEGVTCNLNGILRYYKDGVWVSDDASEIVVMYPDGRVAVKHL